MSHWTLLKLGDYCQIGICEYSLVFLGVQRSEKVCTCCSRAEGRLVRAQLPNHVVENGNGPSFMTQSDAEESDTCGIFIRCGHASSLALLAATQGFSYFFP
jgi:hypothetical protein